MRVLVTGGAGYVGRFCIRRLVDARHTVTSLDRRPHSAAYVGHGHAVHGDIADQELVGRVLREHAIEAVVHLAAEKSVADSMARPGPHLQNNVCGSIALLEAMRRAGVTRIVFSSSAAVYGTPQRLPVVEVAALRPENPYGAGKVMVEEALRWYHVCHGFDSVSLRYFNAAGAADDGSMGEDLTDAPNLIPRVMNALLGASGPVHVFGTDFGTPDGTAIRDYVHVEDLATAHLRALDYVMGHPGADAINVGTGGGSSVREVLHAAEAASGRPLPFEDVPRRAGDPPAVWADTTKAVSVLHWRAERSLADIIQTAWRWSAGTLKSG